MLNNTSTLTWIALNKVYSEYQTHQLQHDERKCYVFYFCWTYSTFWLTDTPLYTQWVWGRNFILDTTAYQCPNNIVTAAKQRRLSTLSPLVSLSFVTFSMSVPKKKRVSWHCLVVEDETSLSIYRTLITTGTSDIVRGQKTQVCLLLSVTNCVEKVVKYLPFTHSDKVTCS